MNRTPNPRLRKQAKARRQLCHVNEVAIQALTDSKYRIVVSHNNDTVKTYHLNPISITFIAVQCSLRRLYENGDLHMFADFTVYPELVYIRK